MSKCGIFGRKVFAQEVYIFNSLEFFSTAWLSGVFIECGNSLPTVGHIHSVMVGSPSYHQLKTVASSGKSSILNKNSFK